MKNIYCEQYQIKNHYIIYRYMERAFLINTVRELQEVELNSVESDIVMYINEEHQLQRVWERIAREYDFSVQDKEASDLFESVIFDFLDKELIEVGNKVVAIYGEEGKCYPISISIELTNACNFKCSHCYKEADNRNSDFISIDAIDKIIKKLENKIYSVEITGGEATLHPHFDYLISKLNMPVISLLTNGSQLQKIDDFVLEKFSSIQISFYGSSKEEYEQYALSDQFDTVCMGIKKVKTLGIPLTVAIILRKSNINRIEQYIDTLLDLGVDHIRFGSSLKIGRNNYGRTTDWDISENECAIFSESLDTIRKNYPTINFDKFELKDGPTFDPTKEKYCFICNAGSKFVVFSEKEKVRPCLYTPASVFEILNLDEYFTLIENGENYDYSKCIVHCLSELRKKQQHLDDICPYGFG